MFPDDKSIQKIIFLSLQNAAKKWTMPIKDYNGLKKLDKEAGIFVSQ
ncbi:hypothetical protein [Candidatus Tisiphia endosymbiont of Parasteatoda lunata]